MCAPIDHRPMSLFAKDDGICIRNTRYDAMPRILRRARLLIDTTVKEQHVDTYTQLTRRHRLPLRGKGG